MPSSRQIPSARLNARAAADLLASGHVARGGIGHLGPGHAPAAGHGRHLEEALAEVVPARRREPVEAAVHQVLGHVYAPPARVHGGRLVLERAHGRMPRRPALPGRVALPHVAALELLAGEPGAPRRPAAGAVLRGALEDPVGPLGPAAGVEAHRGRAAHERLRVRHQNPAAVAGREGRHAVGRKVPAVVRAGHRLVPSGDQPRLKALGEPEAVLVGRAARPVAGARAACRGAGGAEHVIPEGRPEPDHGGRTDSHADELPPRPTHGSQVSARSRRPR